MGRFLVGVLFALALFWGYETFWRADGARAGQLPVPAGNRGMPVAGADAGDGSGSPVVAEHAAADAGLPAAPPGAGAVPGPDESAIDDLANAVVAGDADARGRAFAVLLGLDGRARDRLAAAVVVAGRDASTPDALFGLLGTTNAFLHCEEGRQVADRTLQAIASLPDRPQQLADLTRLVESCMNGPIERSDAAAHAAVDRIRERHRIVARQVAFDPADVTGAKQHVVQAGESLDRIAAQVRKQLGVPIEAGTIAVFNRISNPNMLQVGQRLKIPLDPIRTVVHKASFLMAVYCGDSIVKTYWCAVGREGHDTPEATFRVSAKIVHPDWNFEGRVIPYGHPDNPLGTHFVKFEHPSYTGFGIHGTSEPESIGTRASLGCIRLGADDITDYFQLVPRGSEVEVVR